MGLTGYSAEFESSISPAKLFKATVLDMHQLAPTIMPQLVKSAAILEGDGGVGSLKEYQFTDVFPYSHVKERINVLDKDSFLCKYSLVEGGQMGSKIKSSKYEVKFEASATGGSVCKLSVEMETLDGVEFTQEELNKEKEGMVATYKAVEAYLLANPNA